MYSKAPYTSALAALRDRYGQLRQLVQGELNSLLNTPPIKMDDNAAFQEFTMSVRSFVGLLESVDGENQDGFIEHCYKKDGTNRTYTLQHRSAWLETKAKARSVADPQCPLRKDRTCTEGKSGGKILQQILP